MVSSTTMAPAIDQSSVSEFSISCAPAGGHSSAPFCSNGPPQGPCRPPHWSLQAFHTVRNPHLPGSTSACAAITLFENFEARRPLPQCLIGLRTHCSLSSTSETQGRAMSEEGGRRAKRRCARNKYTSTAMPSAIHYVGYVSGRGGGLPAPAASCATPPLPAAAPPPLSRLCSVDISSLLPRRWRTTRRRR